MKAGFKSETSNHFESVATWRASVKLSPTRESTRWSSSAWEVGLFEDDPITPPTRLLPLPTRFPPAPPFINKPAVFQLVKHFSLYIKNSYSFISMEFLMWLDSRSRYPCHNIDVLMTYYAVFMVWNNLSFSLSQTVLCPRWPRQIELPWDAECKCLHSRQLTWCHRDSLLRPAK